MPNSDTQYGVHNKVTTIFSQPYDGSTALTTFSSVAEAKNYYFTTAARTHFVTNNNCGTNSY